MKKIFLLGDYHALNIGGIKVFKNKNDFFIVTVNVHKNFRHQTQIMLDSVAHVTSMSDSYVSSFKNEKPDFLAVVAGHESIKEMSTFNKTKFFCEENNAEMIVVKTFTQNDLIFIQPSEIYQSISQILTREPV